MHRITIHTHIEFSKLHTKPANSFVQVLHFGLPVLYFQRVLSPFGALGEKTKGIGHEGQLHFDHHRDTHKMQWGVVQCPRE